VVRVVRIMDNVWIDGTRYNDILNVIADLINYAATATATETGIAAAAAAPGTR
jgi:hypothetical protein